MARRPRRRLQAAGRVRDSTKGSLKSDNSACVVFGVSGNPTPIQRAAPPYSDLHLGRTDLDVLLKRRPVRDPGLTHASYEVVGMRKEELVVLLTSMDQQVAKKQPTRLELLGAVVTLLLSWNRLSL